MASTTNLCEVMANALGIERELVLDHARHLHKAGGKFPTDDDTMRAEPEMAASLLVSIMSGLPPSKAPDAVLLYGGLPLESARRGGTQADGSWRTVTVPDDDPLQDDLLAWGCTYGEFLVTLIAWWNEATETNLEVMHFVVGGRRGAASAIIYFKALVEGETVAGDVKFCGTEALDHDGPRACLTWQGIVPGAILPILRELFTDNKDGPREVFTTRADFARLSGGGEA